MSLSVENRLMQLERHAAAQDDRLRRYRMALLAMVLTLVGLTLVAATGNKDVEFGTVTAHSILIKNVTGQPVVRLEADEQGGVFGLYSTTEQPVVRLKADEQGGVFGVYSTMGRPMAGLWTTKRGGVFDVYNATGQPGVSLKANEFGGTLDVYNAAYEAVIQAYADEQGAGAMSLWDNKGIGRTLKPGDKL